MKTKEKHLIYDLRDEINNIKKHGKKTRSNNRERTKANKTVKKKEKNKGRQYLIYILWTDIKKNIN